MKRFRLMQELPGGRLSVGLLIFLALAAVALADRLYHERHYGRMFVRLSERLASDRSVTVFTRRSDGTLTALNRRAEDDRLYSRDSDWKKVMSIVITSSPVDPVRSDEVEVRIGPGWPHTTILPVSSVHLLPLDNPGLQAHRRQLLFEQACEVTVDAATRSLLPLNAGLINWQGDFLLVAHSLCLGLLYFLLLTGVGCILRRLGPLQVTAVPKSGALMRLAAEVVRFFMFVLAIHLAWLWLRQLTIMRESWPLVLGILSAVGIAALIAGWFRVVDRTRSERQLAIRMLFLIFVMALLKLYWLSHVETIPRSDYARYYEYGKQMAAGDWEAIRNGPKGQSALYLRRASVVTFPVAVCFGSSISTFEVVHTVVQCVTAAMFCLLVRQMAGIRAAAHALPLLLISPEIWYQAGMITHNVWGYFWIVATWLAFDCYLKHSAQLERRTAGWLRRISGAVFWGIGIGIGITMVDLTKGYGIFFLVALPAVIVVGPRIMKLLTDCAPDGMGFIPGRFTFLLVALMSSRMLTTGADSFLLSRSGLKLPPGWIVAHACSVEAAGAGGGEALAVWISRYHYLVPESHRQPLVLRKLLHEKVGEATEVLLCAFRKNRLLFSVVDAMGHSQDSVSPATAAPTVDNVRFGAIQFVIGNVVMLASGICFLARLMLRECLVSSWSELFPLLTTGVVLAVIYLAFEAHPYYAINFVLLFSWSAGVVLDRLRRPFTAHAVSAAFPVLRLFSPDRLTAVAAGLLLLGCYCLLGAAVDRSGLTFFRVAAGAGSHVQEDGKDAWVQGLPQNAASGVSRVHGWLEFRPESGMVRKGEKISQQFVVQCGGRWLPGLSFFISGNQRARINRINDEWKSLPFLYSVSIEDFKLAENRPLEELAFPRFRGVPKKFWDPDGTGEARNVTVTVSLECTADIAIGRLSPPPAIALEYFH
ncbi:MAG: hypothetical protein ACKO2P_17610 [Planctomycetota bacterium]